MSTGRPIFVGDLVGRRLAAQFLDEEAADARELVDRLDHVDRDADRARLVGDGARDRLPDPPCGVGRELVAALVLELVHGAHQADVALLDQVQELQAAVRVLLRDGDDEAQVGLDDLHLGLVRDLLARLDLLHDHGQFVEGVAGFLLQALDDALGVAHALVHLDELVEAQAVLLLQRLCLGAVLARLLDDAAQVLLAEHRAQDDLAGSRCWPRRCAGALP